MCIRMHAIIFHGSHTTRSFELLKPNKKTTAAKITNRIFLEADSVAMSGYSLVRVGDDTVFGGRTWERYLRIQSRRMAAESSFPGRTLIEAGCRIGKPGFAWDQKGKFTLVSFWSEVPPYSIRLPDFLPSIKESGRRISLWPVI